jgi:dihydroflavonol-4-reductase
MIFGIASFSEYFSKFSKRPFLINRSKVKEMVQKDWVCDIAKAKTILGFKPQVKLLEGARLTFAWYKEENWL